MLTQISIPNNLNEIHLANEFWAGVSNLGDFSYESFQLNPTEIKQNIIWQINGNFATQWSEFVSRENQRFFFVARSTTDQQT